MFMNKVIEKGPRQRLLTDLELVVIWRALDASHYADIIRLLILTGARREEIGGLMWAEVDFDAAVINLPGERTKSRQPHIVPLSGLALDSADVARCGGREFA